MQIGNSVSPERSVATSCTLLGGIFAYKGCVLAVASPYGPRRRRFPENENGLPLAAPARVVLDPPPSRLLRPSEVLVAWLVKKAPYESARPLESCMGKVMLQHYRYICRCMKIEFDMSQGGFIEAEFEEIILSRMTGGKWCYSIPAICCWI